jgi:S1-C subfamily serine protease
MEKPSTSGTEHQPTRFTRVRGAIKRSAPFALGILAAFAAMLLYNLVFPAPHVLTSAEVNDSIVQAMGSATPPPPFSSKVYQSIQPSLVLIQTKASSPHGMVDFGLGSGVVINDRGDILTSLHVIENSSEIQLTFADGTQSTAEIIGAQPENDIAVLMAHNPPVQVIPAVLGNPNAMRVGDEAFAVGNPFGLYGSISAGVISGFDRTFTKPNSEEEMDGLIQIDAAVNPGNSGGPLLNRDGQVVAIVVGIVNPTQEDFFIGIGFAVPIDVAGAAAGLPQY